MAHKKAGGSTQNIRDSKPKFRGIKKFGGESVVAGNVIARQKGSKYAAGENTYMGRDFTIHAATEGKVKFHEKRILKFDNNHRHKTVISVEPKAAK